MWSSHHKEPVEVVLEFIYLFIYFNTMSYWEEAPMANLNTLGRLHCSAGWKCNEEPNERLGASG